jgi:hypothetical protein
MTILPGYVTLLKKTLQITSEINPTNTLNRYNGPRQPLSRSLQGLSPVYSQFTPSKEKLLCCQDVTL